MTRGSFRPRFATLMAALCAIALVAAGCGSDGGGNSSGDSQAEIKSLVQETFAFEDPAAVCAENLTEALLEESYEGNDRETRVEECIAEKPADIGEIEFRKIEVKGDTATAAVEAVRPNGRSSKFTVELRDEDGWKLDEVG